jgi:hypothetical protein
VGHQVRRQCQEHRRGESVFGQRDRRGEHLVERQPAEPLVQRQPPVHRSWNRHAPDVSPQRHHPVTLGAQRCGVGVSARSADTEERQWSGVAGRLDHGEHVTAETAQVRAGDCHHGASRDRGVSGRAARVEHAHARGRSQLVGGGDHASSRHTAWGRDQGGHAATLPAPPSECDAE